MAVPAGKLTARRPDCAPGRRQVDAEPAGTSKLEPTLCHKISHNPVAIRALLVDLFLEAHERASKQTILDPDSSDDPLHDARGSQSSFRRHIAAPLAVSGYTTPNSRPPPAPPFGSIRKRSARSSPRAGAQPRRQAAALRGHSRADAIRAPSTSASSFAQATSVLTSSPAADVAKPQSLLASTFSRPTMLA